MISEGVKNLRLLLRPSETWHVRNFRFDSIVGKLTSSGIWERRRQRKKRKRHLTYKLFRKLQRSSGFPSSGIFAQFHLARRPRRIHSIRHLQFIENALGCNGFAVGIPRKGRTPKMTAVHYRDGFLTIQYRTINNHPELRLLDFQSPRIFPAPSEFPEDPSGRQVMLSERKSASNAWQPPALPR